MHSIFQAQLMSQESKGSLKIQRIVKGLINVSGAFHVCSGLNLVLENWIRKILLKTGWSA